ncbi:endonuclease domain-containing protein [Nocardioides sp. CPCC 205120]|uniref:endonuclease domain-containing protein n=1 Tax=Nocardioides sp. CPCC 205120 TaxID=3406462 RepID=UPI003B504812
MRGKGGPAVRRVVAAASPLAANPFESVLRGIALEAGLDAVPQGAVEVGGLHLVGGDPEVVHPDVVDRGRRIALEADSWEFHSDKEAFQRDCWRYTVLVAHGWVVLRFTWWQVMHHPGWVRECVRRAAERAAA